MGQQISIESFKSFLRGVRRGTKWLSNILFWGGRAKSGRRLEIAATICGEDKIPPSSRFRSCWRDLNFAGPLPESAFNASVA
jgi:hypothetical protein